MQGVENPEEKVQSEAGSWRCSLHLVWAVNTGSRRLREYKAEDTIWVLKTNKQAKPEMQEIHLTFKPWVRQLAKDTRKSGNGGVRSSLNVTDDTARDSGQQACEVSF